MERNYLLRVIRKRYVLLDKDEIVIAVANSSFFDGKLAKLIKEKSNCLNDIEYLPQHHRLFFETVQSIIRQLNECDVSEYQLIKATDAVVLALSVYNAYSAIASPAVVYRLMREAEKRNLILG